ncbi:MAG: winged helix-turn-helix domain-containing protein, partial [Acidobacteria bacterium]|nr:winged helix-turn-helix domain-containing protein [Acidobacteriota bacterium]
MTIGDEVKTARDQESSTVPSNSIKRPQSRTEDRRMYTFGPFRLDAGTRRLLCGGEPVALTAKAFDTLLALVEHRGRLVEKDELMQWLWPDRAVEDANLTQTVFLLRKVLGESPGEHRYIATIPRRGYQFVASVQEVAAVEPATASASPELPGSRPAEAAAMPSLAVLPFTSLAPESGDEVFGLGLADALTTRLGNLGAKIIVRPTSAVRSYVSTSPGAVAAGRELAVDTVLEGSVQRVGERIRVSVQLVSVQTAAAIWGERFDEKFTDIFSVEDSISERIAAALAANLTGAEKRRLTKRYTDSPTAYESYWKGRFHWNRRTAGDRQKAVRHFEVAIEQDPDYALAFSGLADCYALLGSAGYDAEPRRELLAKARTAAMKAIAIDQDLAEAHTSLGLVKFRMDWAWAEAEHAFRHAIELNPGYASAHHFLSLLLCALGRTEEAIATIRQARDLDPLSLIIGTAVGRVHHFARQYDVAIEECRKAREMDPGFAGAHLDLGLACVQKSMLHEAIAELRQALTLSDSQSLALAVLGYGLARAGDTSAAVDVLAQLHERPKRRDVPALHAAYVQIGLGNFEQAFDDSGGGARRFRRHEFRGDGRRPTHLPSSPRPSARGAALARAWPEDDLGATHGH